jgi:hypothetical protein
MDNRQRNKLLLFLMLATAVVAGIAVIYASLGRNRNLRRVFRRKNAFDEELTADEWRYTYQFDRRGITRLHAALKLPDFILDDVYGHKADSLDVLMWLLYRYVGGRTELDCQRHFGVHRSTIGRLSALDRSS